MLDLGFNAVWKALLKEFLTMPDDPTPHNCRVCVNDFVNI
jgi:hypothetical protein